MTIDLLPPPKEPQRREMDREAAAVLAGLLLGLALWIVVCGCADDTCPLRHLRLLPPCEKPRGADERGGVIGHYPLFPSHRPPNWDPRSGGLGGGCK